MSKKNFYKNIETGEIFKETSDNEGLATASLVKSYVEDKITEIEIPTVPEYTIEALETATMRSWNASNFQLHNKQANL